VGIYVGFDERERVANASNFLSRVDASVSGDMRQRQVEATRLTGRRRCERSRRRGPCRPGSTWQRYLVGRSGRGEGRRD